MNSEMRLLIVIRHAEPQGHSPHGDLGRELTPHGDAQAREVGRWLAEQGVRPDAAIVSPSVRTQQTWAAMVAGGLPTTEVRTDRAVYEASVADLAEAVSTLGEDVRTAVLVGHAPGVPGLVSSLEAHAELPDGWTPATLGIISHAGEWGEFPGAETAVVRCRMPDEQM